MTSSGVYCDEEVYRYLSDVAVLLFNSVVVLIPNGSFWDVPVLHSMSDMFPHCETPRFTPTQNNSRNYSSLYIVIFIVFASETDGKTYA
jgi:hypothetical protein